MAIDAVADPVPLQATSSRTGAPCSSTEVEAGVYRRSEASTIGEMGMKPIDTGIWYRYV